MATDKRKVSLLSLLDMSDAFDCVDHLVMLQRLIVVLGIVGTAFDWFQLVPVVSKMYDG